ncbi:MULTISPECIES: sigma-54-dependent Fis family transcriptional regulator [Sphingobium]|uniref:Sigma-54-dependent Fis family transcriptional regulator n=1 Tax=Sphingobium fuliginis (strain ATCC 27551) TaxID=336203 RepID=A0ABQ1F238_SPHSA|nr:MULTISPECIES: sigma-54-dependent Fis family transcriptional regulator [Sphingobium]RYL97246.1 sigma-54-dependent Fis family transcriptional regulator [Sphingobium fuliginis]WDA35660.1 sigma 54-interacting transcriptional regulator [Sphingobium sp. YC-XJ3]GFZ96191.1 sigma-54-dependent Fis family transcriptional regulator [Sphingobium fuliginis]
MASKALDDRSGRIDLWSKLRFDPGTGTVWLDEQRMLLLHAGSLGALRAEMVRTLGEGRAGALLMRMGYQSGMQDAEIARKMVGDRDYEEVFLLGPRLHKLEGLVQVETIRCELDLDAGRFHGEFRWTESWEAESQIVHFGIGEHATCWNQLGYASGYVSAFMGRPVIFRETMCKAKGDPHCTIVGEIASDLPADDPYLKAMHPEDIAGQLRAMAEEIGELRASLRREKQAGSLIGQSPAFLKSMNLLRRAADSSITVLLTGETGVGKEVFAHWLHDNGPRRDKPFVAINCGAIPHDLIESELFGVEPGAYTGAQRQRLGRFERADGGTLFLDEVGDLPLPAQVKLLRVLQTGEVERLGGDRLRHVDVRIVAATNVDLASAVAARTFRADLFYRLNPFPVAIPPLRDRAADIPLFVEALVERLTRRHGKPVRGVSDQAMRALIAYRWPGNVRELENVLERGVLLAEPGGRIDVDTLSIVLEPDSREQAHVRPDGRLAVTGAPLIPDIDRAPLLLADYEAALVEEALRRAGGNVADAARMLGMSRRQLDYRLKQAGG